MVHPFGVGKSIICNEASCALSWYDRSLFQVGQMPLGAEDASKRTLDQSLLAMEGDIILQSLRSVKALEGV
jgi:hypothetical protein